VEANINVRGPAGLFPCMGTEKEKLETMPLETIKDYVPYSLEIFFQGVCFPVFSIWCSLIVSHDKTNEFSPQDAAPVAFAVILTP